MSVHKLEEAGYEVIQYLGEEGKYRGEFPTSADAKYAMRRLLSSKSTADVVDYLKALKYVKTSKGRLMLTAKGIQVFNTLASRSA